MYFDIILRYQLLDIISGSFRNFTIECVVEQPYSSTQADVWNMFCLKESGCISLLVRKIVISWNLEVKKFDSTFLKFF